MVRAQCIVMTRLARLFAVLLLSVGSGSFGAARASEPAATDQVSLASRLQAEPAALTRDLAGRATAIFDLPPHEARLVFLPVGRERPLPDGYEPPDLTRRAGRPVRELVVGDLQALIDAAATDNVDLAVVSAYRSPSEQAAAFESSVWRAIARAGGTLDRAEAETRASRFVAPPGHSQHQLGTAVDFSTWEIGYAVQPAFDETAASRWLTQNAWVYGFVLAYPREKESRTGYAYEPWHWRWLGRPLAATLWRDRYLDHPTLVADDYLRAVEALMDAEGVR
jgi:D-alanyl-D-alanine carboxypeptidase